MALSKAALERIKSKTDEKYGGPSVSSSGTTGSGNTSQGSYTGSLSSSLRSRVALNTALKRAGITSETLASPKYENYHDALSAVDDDYVSRFISDWNSYSDRINRAYDGMNWSSAKSWRDDRASADTAEDLMFRSAVIRAYIDSNRDSIDDAGYRQLASQLESIQKSKRDFDNVLQYYSQWETEEDYDTAVRYDGYNKKYSGQSRDNIQKALSTLEDGEERWWLAQMQHDLYQGDKAYMSKAMSGLKSYEAQKVVEHEKEEEKSWFENALASFAKTGDTTLPAANLTNVTSAYHDDTSYREPSDLWTEGERREFGYLYAEDPKKAYAYAEQVNRYYTDKAERDAQVAAGANASKDFWSGAANTAGAIATAPLGVGLADYLDNLAEYVGRGTITNDGYLSPNEYFNAATSGVANTLNEKYGAFDEDLWMIGGKGVGDLYSLGVSGAQSIASSLAFGGPAKMAGSAMGLTGKELAAYAAKEAAIPTMAQYFGMGAASGIDDVMGRGYTDEDFNYGSGYYALKRGATPEQAMTYGTIMGAMEGVAEALSVDNLIKVGSAPTFKNWLLSSLNQGLGELQEEGLTSIVDAFADYWIMADKSKFSEYVQKFTDAGAENPELKALLYMAGDVAFDAMGGFATGVGNAMTVGGINTGMDARRGNTENIKALEQYGEHTDALIQEGLESDKKSASYKLAQKYQQQVQGKDGKQGKAMTGYQIRNLVAANEEQFAVENFKEVRNEAKDRLKEIGANASEYWTLAELVAKRVTGQELTKAEKTTLAKSQYGSKVAKDMIDAAKENKVTYKPLTDRVGQEGRYNVSENGQTQVRGEENTVKISEVTKIDEDGQLTVKLEDGREVYAGDIDFANDSESFLYSALADMENMTPAAASALAKGINPTSVESVGRYVNGVDEAYNYGYRGYSVEDLKSGDYAIHLSNEQMMSAYRLGQSARKIGIQEHDAPLVKMRTAKMAAVSKKAMAAQQKARFESDAEVYFMDGKNAVRFDEHTGEYNDVRMAGVNAAKAFHKLGIGGKYYFYESYEKNGNRYYKNAAGVEKPAPNGIFTAEDGSIYIDLNAGENGQGVTLYTLSHELGHFVKHNSAKQFQRLADLVTEAFGKTDMTMHERVVEKQNRLSQIRDKHVTYDEAYEEVVCDALSTMLADGSFMEKVAEIKVKDKSLFNTIKSFFDKLFAKFKEVYANLTPDQKDAQDIRQMKEMFDKIQTAFAEALVEASDNFRAVEAEAVESLGKNAKVETNSKGELLLAANEQGNVLMYSERTYLNGGREKLEMALRQNGHTAAEIQKTLSYVDDALDYIKILAAGYAKNMGYTNLSNHLVADIVTNVKTGKQVMSAIVNNGDYPVNIDLSLICKKRVAYMNLMSRLIRDGVFDKVNYDGAAIAEVNEILRENGFETACLGCFVESRRLQFQTWAETIVSEWNAEVEKRNPNAKNFGFAKGKMENLSDADINALTRELESVKKNDQGNVNLGQGNSVTRMGRLLDALPSLQKKLTVEDLLTPEGLTALRKHDGSLFSIVKSRYGAASPKIVQDFNPYASEIAMLTFAQVKGITNNAVKGAQAYITEVKNEYGKLKKNKGESKADFDHRKNDHEQRIQDEAMRRYLYDIGGARIQSFSDFMIENVFDYIQIFADLAAKRLPLHGYTKEIVAMRLFGMTGAKWNGSLIAHVERNMGKEFAGLLPAGTKDGIPVKVNGKDYVIGFDDHARNAATGGKSFIQSIGMKDVIALQLDPRYSPYVGNITIGVSDAQILAMLDSPLFRMVIPYHASGMLPMFAKLVGVDMYNDYTDYQNTTVRQYYDLNGNAVTELKNAKGETVKADTSYAFNAEIQKTKDAKTAANNYLKWCAQRHEVYDGSKLVGYATFNPKFSSSPYGTDFTRHENYYKLLEDFNTYDCITEASTVQGAVTMNFPSEENRMTAQQMAAYKQALRDTGIFTEKDIEKYAKKADMTFKEIIDAEVGNRANYAATQQPKWESTVKAVEAKLQKDYARTEKNSDREYMAAVKAGDMETAQRMVEQAARESGYDSELLYHGTRQFGFTKLKTEGVEKGIDWSPFFTTNKLNTAQTYSRWDKVTRVSDARETDYDAVIEAEEKNWNEAISDFADAVSRFVGVRGWLDQSYVEDKIGYLFNDVVNGNLSRTDANSEIYDWIDGELYAEIFDAVRPYEFDSMSEEELEEAEEKLGDEIQDCTYGYLTKFTSVINSVANVETDARGNYQFYANTDNLFVIDAKGNNWKSIDFEADGYYYLNGMPRKKWTTRLLAEYAKDNGYNGVRVKNLFDDGGQGVDKQYAPSDVYIFFDPQSQVKSADPVTYDDSGKVIPLSERFKQENDDIRYSDRDSTGKVLTKDQIEFFKDSVMRDENGNLMPMYHGTNNPNFTVFDPQFSDDQRSLFFTSDPDVANTYTQQQDYGRDVDPYNLITKDSSAAQFNAAQEKAGGGLRVIQITKEWLAEMKRTAMQNFAEMIPEAEKYASLLEQSGVEKAMDYADRIRTATSKGVENLTASDVSDIQGAMFGGSQAMVFNKNAAVGKAAREQYKVLRDKLLSAERYAIAAETPANAVGKYTFTERNDMVPFSVATMARGNSGGTFVGSESEAVERALDRTKWVHEHSLGNRYKVYLNLKNPYILDAGNDLSGKMDRVAMSYSYISESWRVEMEYGDEEMVKHMKTADFEAFVGAAFDAETAAKINGQIEADNDAYRRQWGDLDPDDVEHDIQLQNVNISYVEPGNWNDLHDRAVADYFEMDEDEPLKTRNVAKYAMDHGYDGVIFKNMKDTGGYAFMKGRGASTVAVAFRSEQVKSVENKKPTADPDIRYSDRDSAGAQLTKEQQEFFKNSKVRDDEGNLKVMYHGTEKAGFHVFDPKYSDDGISLFFTDHPDVAYSYSGTTGTYSAKVFRTAEDLNSFLSDIKVRDYEVRAEDGKFRIYEDDSVEAESDTAQGLYERIRDWPDISAEIVNYKVYLNLTNPLVVDAEGRNWDDISTDFWPELYNQWVSEFTQEEKEALISLAKQGDSYAFRVGINRAVREAGKPTADEYTKALDSGYWKNSDMDSLYRMAADNFSDEILRAEAVKQMTTRDYAKRAKEQGYDGVIFRDIVDIGEYGRKYHTSTVCVAFSSEQIKSVANKTPTADPDIRYSLRMVDAVQPSTDKWSRTHTTEEAMARFPNMWNVSAEESEVRNPTQIVSTVNSYRKIYNYLQKEGFNGTILDASSGLGYGTRAGIEEYGFNVEDIEPYPDKSYSPKYTDYSALDKKYDVIISNAVLNVLPQDQRDALVAKMSELLNNGGRMFINVRGKDVESLAKTGKNIHLGNMEWIETVKGSYQKGFTKPELVAYLQDALGDGYRVNPTSMFGAVSAVVTKEQVKSALEEGQAMYSERTGDSVSNRALLANAFEGISQNSVEYKMIQDYKGHIKELNELETKLSQLNSEIRKIRFGKGEYDAEKLRQLEDEAKKTAKEINRYDKRLLNMEASEPLRKVIERERKKEAQKTKDHVKQIQESKKVRADQAELRHKIRKVVRDLDKILNRGNKKLNVKEDMQNVVTKALKAADILFTDNYGTYDMLRNGIGADLSDAEEELVNTCTRMLKDLDKMPTDGYDSWQARQEAESRLKAKMSKLKDVFARERKRLNNTTVSSILGELADAYASLEKSEQSYVQGAYTEAVHNFLKSLQSEVGGTIVKDMTKDQLESVYTAYKMVLTAVRTANKMFNEELKQSREQLGNAVIREVIAAGGTHGLWTKAEIARSQADWNNTKPVWVANRIGSDTFGKLMNGLFKGQYNFAVDIEEAKQFKLSMDQKYRPRNWDAKKLYHFESSTGKKFSLNLQQIMSLYAFSKREQAYSHLLNGGFVFENNSTVVVDQKGIKRTYLHDGATSYKLNEATLNEIIKSLTAEQKAYVDEMQAYLSDVMGAKGNEVSMKLYGIQMFKEKFYFPLRSSGAYMERAKEAELKKQQGQINLVNSGFTHAVKPEAKNPIILSGFMDVWAEHCNEMSMYHSMVLPMEDFRKVYNYSTVHDDKFDSASVYQTIQDAYGKAATDYIDQLYRELNAGATVDPRETAFKARISKFKKAAVMLSASVVVQQFSSVGRAYAIIDPKYFIGTKVKSSTNLSVADEMKKFAPVAIIKEMGGFDTGTKGSAKSYIMAEKYGKGERIKGVVKDEQYRGDIMGYFPAKADEITWCAIWEAVKRETRAKHPKMDVKSEQFLKLAGERFSEVIEKTQVYDSVLARSANMRSKSGLMQMATSFMAEPTTTVNLLEDALRSRSVKKIASTFGAVAVSIVMNNALASIVYAMRDDDEDETFIEKYFQSLASGMIDDINPMSYYPFLKDVYSLFQGYDVERADMSVIADLRDALKKAVSVIGKDTSDMDEDELAAHWKNVNGVLMSLLDAGCSALGVPAKNVRRDVKGIINAYTTIRTDLTERDTTWLSFWDKVGAAAKDTIPVYAWTKDRTKPDKLYEAIMAGDTQYVARLKSGYKTEDSYRSAVRKALRENDPRIKEAAQAHINGDPSERVRIARQIIADGFALDDVITAINSEISAMTPSGESSAKKEKGFYTAEDFAREIANGDLATAKAVKTDIIQTAQKNGKSKDEAEKSFNTSAKGDLKEMFLAGSLSKTKAVKALTAYCGDTQEDAEKRVGEWAFQKEYGFVYSDRSEAYKDGAISAAELQDVLVTIGGKTEEEAMWQIKVYDWQKEGFDIDSSQKGVVEDYETFCKPAGIDKNTYFNAYLFYNDSGEEGVYNSKVKECMPYIGTLPLTSAQKTALAKCWWADSTIRRYKTW